MKVKIVFFDCDGVLLLGNPWEKLTQLIGLPRELDQKWLNEYYADKITFEEWMANVRNFYIKASLDRKTVDEAFGPRDTQINKEAEEVFVYLNGKGIKTAIVSSGSESYVSRVATHFNVPYYRYNTIFVFDDNDKFVEIKNFGEDPDVKVTGIKEICEELKIKPNESVFIGDSSNDWKAFEFTGRGIMYGSHPKLEKFAWKTVKDLREVIKIIESENGSK